MSDNKDILVAQLESLKLSNEAARIYLELVKEPSTHLRLSHATGVNRTKVYRLVEQLEKRSLVARRTDDRGTFLVAADPATLEVELITQEEALRHQRDTLQQLMQTLTALQTNDSSSFIVRTYEGQAGLKQMCWHELRAKGELLGLGYGTIELIVADDGWAARHRARQLAAQYTIRELVNETTNMPMPILADEKIIKSKLYFARSLPSSIISFDNQTIIYNNTVAIYHWKEDQKVGVEIISKSYAAMFRQLFEYYWSMAAPIPE